MDYSHYITIHNKDTHWSVLMKVLEPTTECFIAILFKVDQMHKNLRMPVLMGFDWILRLSMQLSLTR